MFVFLYIYYVKPFAIVLFLVIFGWGSLNTEIFGEDSKSKILSKLEKQNTQKLKQIYFFYQELTFKKNQIAYMLDIQNSKANFSSDLRYTYIPDLHFSIFFGNYFLREIWNQTVFLKESISSDLYTQYSFRKFKGVYPMIESQKLFYGIFYLEDLSKGVFWGFENNLFLWDFYKKKWLIYSKNQIQKHFFYINWEGEKKENQGYTFYSFLEKEYSIQVFGMRNSFWDYYQYFEDNYDQNNHSYIYQSFLGSFSFQLNQVQFYFGHHKKGNVRYLKTESAYRIFDVNNFRFLIGIDFYQRFLESNTYKRENYNQNMKIYFYYENFIYSFEYRIFRNFYNLIYKISYKKYKNQFVFGILYQDYDVKRISESLEIIHFEFLENSNSHFLLQKEFFFDRSYISGVINATFYFDGVSFSFKSYYTKKFLSKENQKEMNSLEVSFVVEI